MKKRTGFQTMKRLLEPAILEWKSTLSFMVFDILSGIMGVALIYGMQYVVEAIELSDMKRFRNTLLILCGIAVFSFFLRITRKPYIFSFFKNIRGRVDKICLPVVINGDNNRYESIGTGRMIGIYSKGNYTREMILTRILGDMPQSLVLFIAFLYSVYNKDTTLFYASVLVIVLCFIRLRFLVPYTYKRRKKAKEVGIEISRIQTRWFMNKFEIMQQGKISNEIDRRIQANEEWYGYKFQEKLLQGLAFDGGMLLSTILFLALVYYIGIQTFNGVATYSDLVLIVGLGGAFIRDLDGLLRGFRIIMDKRVDVTKLWDLVDSLESKSDNDEGDVFIYKTGKIKVSNLDYGYSESDNIFKNFGLVIQGGKKTALVGVSGSGKSTLVKLIAGYLRPDSGSIVVDGQDLSEVALKSYYPHIGYLTQEPSVFDGTIRENLIYAVSDDIAQEKVEEAISLSKCEFVYDLPDGIDTEIGERGVRLSGGQRQRLAIAKIFLKNPKIIILDEPTSALDSFSEEAITEAMHTLFENRTVIIIAHRLQTVKEADDIILLEQGEVVERGTHEELVRLGGQYARMLEVQTGF